MKCCESVILCLNQSMLRLIGFKPVNCWICLIVCPPPLKSTHDALRVTVNVYLLSILDIMHSHRLVERNIEQSFRYWTFTVCTANIKFPFRYWKLYIHMGLYSEYQSSFSLLDTGYSHGFVQWISKFLFVSGHWYPPYKPMWMYNFQYRKGTLIFAVQTVNVQ